MLINFAIAWVLIGLLVSPTIYLLARKHYPSSVKNRSVWYHVAGFLFNFILWPIGASFWLIWFLTR